MTAAGRPRQRRCDFPSQLDRAGPDSARIDRGSARIDRRRGARVHGRRRTGIHGRRRTGICGRRRPRVHGRWRRAGIGGRHRSPIPPAATAVGHDGTAIDGTGASVVAGWGDHPFAGDPREIPTANPFDAGKAIGALGRAQAGGPSLQGFSGLPTTGERQKHDPRADHQTTGEHDCHFMSEYARPKGRGNVDRSKLAYGRHLRGARGRGDSAKGPLPGSESPRIRRRRASKASRSPAR